MPPADIVLTLDVLSRLRAPAGLVTTDSSTHKCQPHLRGCQATEDLPKWAPVPDRILPSLQLAVSVTAALRAGAESWVQRQLLQQRARRLTDLPGLPAIICPPNQGQRRAQLALTSTGV